LLSVGKVNWSSYGMCRIDGVKHHQVIAHDMRLEPAGGFGVIKGQENIQSWLRVEKIKDINIEEDTDSSLTSRAPALIAFSYDMFGELLSGHELILHDFDKARLADLCVVS
jgi:hypothetical protein